MLKPCNELSVLQCYLHVAINRMNISSCKILQRKRRLRMKSHRIFFRLQPILISLIRLLLPSKIGLTIISIRKCEISIHDLPLQCFIKTICICIGQYNDAKIFFRHKRNTRNESIYASCMRYNLPPFIFLQKPSKSIKCKMTFVEQNSTISQNRLRRSRLVNG